MPTSLGDRTEMIDLSDDWALPAEDPGSPPLPPLRDLRRRAGYAVALALAAVLGASAAPVRDIAELAAFELPGVSQYTGSEAVQHSGDLLLVLGTTSLTAYASADGALRWSTPYATPVPGQGFATAAAGVVLAVSDTGVTSVFDRETGAPLWSAPRQVYPVDGVGVQVAVYGDWFDPATPAPGAPDRRADEVTGYDLRTGRTLWTLRGTPFAAVNSERGVVLTATAQGEVAVHDVHDGHVVRRGQAGFPPGRPVFLYSFQDSVQLGSMPPVREPAAPDVTIQQFEYDLVTLKALPQGSYAVPCGRYRCVSQSDGTEGEFRMLVTDPATGADRWRTGPDQALLPTGDGFVVLDVSGTSNMRGVDAVYLADPDTGRPLVDLDGWLVLGAEDGSGDYVLLRDVGQTVQVARIVEGGVRVLGVLPRRAQRCFYRASRLACVFGGNHLALWRIGTPGGR
ncbi:PQQ-binding-like beta-propeller repeat protein [Catellatospora sp. TT07R-123]|uniref:outer membrane protein assembly factor BamB family protein n=1 Tax=Catellatospora sp. TT07R-123 TaxID=2733863 RepID=UPI001BB40A8B|nr:PQQ-binding-like beta-propeller repeat protein [Catellatospora sp. TT07R-123]